MRIIKTYTKEENEEFNKQVRLYFKLVFGGLAVLLLIRYSSEIINLLK
jgi:hypothetical protein